MLKDKSSLLLRGATEDDKKWIVQKFMKTVPQYYEDSEESYCNLWWESYFSNRNEVGFFSLKKEVLVFDKRNIPIGFVVLTYKRGGSVKVSPLILERNRKDLEEAFSLIQDHVRSKNGRKIYFDIPSSRWHLFSLLDSLKIKIEAHLERQYSADYDCIVGGLFCNPTAPTLIAPPLNFDLDTELPKAETWLPLEERYRTQLNYFIKRFLSCFYDDLDESFASSIYRGMLHTENMFEEKGKYAYIKMAENTKNIVSLCVLTPKRGGALKLGPLQFACDVDSSEYICESLLSLITIAKQIPNSRIRKLYTLIPILDKNLHAPLQNVGFKPEGVLREPYKTGVDFIVYGLFIH